MRDLILGPLITEKSMKDAQLGKFTFRVAKLAGKKDIRSVIQKRFKVNVMSISTQTIKPKQKRTMQKSYSMTSFWKKAVVELKKGEKISLFDLGATK